MSANTNIPGSMPKTPVANNLSASPRVAMYAGSFDPPTLGHVQVIKRAALMYDKVLVAVGTNPAKTNCAFSVEERLCMLADIKRQFKLNNVEICHYSGEFLVAYAHKRGAGVLIRGIRDAGDLSSEYTLMLQNEGVAKTLGVAPLIHVWLPTERHQAEISSSAVRGMVGFDGWEQQVRRYVPEAVYKKLLQKYGSAGGAANAGKPSP